MTKIKKTTNIIIGISLLVMAWQIAIVLGQFHESLFPPPLKVADGIASLFQDGVLIADFKISLMRFVCGYVVAAVLGVGFGVLLGRWERLGEILDPAIQVLRPIAPIAWSPFIVLWFGIGNIPAIVIIFLAAFYPILLATITGVRKVDLKYMKLAQNLELPKLHVMTKIILPAAFPSIVSGLHQAVGTGWIFLVSGEMVGAQSGLGYLIFDSRNTMRMDLVMAGILCIGICGLALDRLVSLFEGYIERKWGMVKE